MISTLFSISSWYWSRYQPSPSSSIESATSSFSCALRCSLLALRAVVRLGPSQKCDPTSQHCLCEAAKSLSTDCFECVQGENGECLLLLSVVSSVVPARRALSGVLYFRLRSVRTSPSLVHLFVRSCYPRSPLSITPLPCLIDILHFASFLRSSRLSTLPL